MRSNRSPRSWSVRHLGVILAGMAVLAACAPPPAEQPEGAAADPVSQRRGPDRRGRHRQPGSTTTTTAPSKVGAPGPTSTVPGPITTVTAPTTTVPAPTTTVPAPTTVPGTTGPLPQGASGSWTLKFADEFDGTSLDLGKWRPNWFGASDTAVTRPVNDYEESCYDPAQVSVSAGTLKLTATRLASPRSGCTTKDGSPASHASGMVMSNYDYRFTYGFIESRIHLPGGVEPQNWAAFWANGQNWPQDGEIDVMETLGGEPRWHFHYAGSNGSDRSYGSAFDLIAPKSGWHTFGAQWEPGKITFYYDGRAVGSVTSNVTSSPMYLILNYGLSSYISGPVVAPSTMQVDYVRHWQR